MAIFSRRTIQKMINENAEFLTSEQIEIQISRLNKNGFDSIATEWEIVVLNVFSKIGQVVHEPDLGTAAKLDLHFKNQADKSEFIADITTISDERYEDQTPLKAFEIDLWKHVKNANIPLRGFHWSVHAQPPPTTVEVKLMLPKREHFSKEIFNKKFKNFLRMVKQSPSEPHSHEISTKTTRIDIIYDPVGNGVGGGHVIHTLAASKMKNTLYNALKAKRRKQVNKKIDFNGAKGIIVCDGGSHLFNAKPSRNDFPYFNAEEIIKEFLRQNESIDFIVAISIKSTHSGSMLRKRERPFRKVTVEIYPGKNFGALTDELRNSLSELEGYFPEPFILPDNERDNIRRRVNPKNKRPLLKSISVSDTEIRLLANNLFSLLEGAITQEKFFNLSRFDNYYNGTTNSSNPFEHFQRLKKRIVEVRVEEVHDCTYVVFKYNDHDPANSDFLNPLKD